MTHHELHGMGIGGDLFHLSEIDHKSGTDEAYADSFFMTFVHTTGKGTNK